MLREVIEILRKPSAEVLAQRELDEARRQLLQAQAGKEYAAALVTYNEARIVRLERFLSLANKRGAE